MQKINLLIINGTNRPGNNSSKVSKYILDVAKNYEQLKPKLVSPEDFDLPFDGSGGELSDPKYTELAQWADAFFIVTPEYNHSFPGSLKRLLDSEFTAYKHKPVAMAGVSAGPWGGTRVLESLVNVLREFGMSISAVDVHFPKVGSLFDETGKILDAAYNDRVKKSLDELLWLSIALKQGRESTE